MKMAFKWRQNLKEDDINISKVEDDLHLLKLEYLSNHWKDLPRILDLSYGDRTAIEYCFKGMRPLMEDDIKISKLEDDLNILKLEYLSNHWKDLP